MTSLLHYISLVSKEILM